MSTTVGIPNYNNERYVGEAIRSALEQADEVIVVDDASTDGSLDVIGEYACDLTLIRHDVNTGDLTTGWNEIIEEARCDRIVFLSSDDVLAPNAVSRMDIDADWVYGDLTLIDADGNPFDEWAYVGWPQDPLTALARGLARPSIPVTMFASFRTDWLIDNDLHASRFASTPYASDTKTCLDWLKAWPSIRRVPEVTFRYRRHGDAESATIDHAAVEAAKREWYHDNFDARTLSVLSRL